MHSIDKPVRIPDKAQDILAAAHCTTYTMATKDIHDLDKAAELGRWVRCFCWRFERTS